jgi:hypothetical protein
VGVRRRFCGQPPPLNALICRAARERCDHAALRRGDPNLPQSGRRRGTPRWKVCGSGSCGLSGSMRMGR